MGSVVFVKFKVATEGSCGHWYIRLVWADSGLDAKTFRDEFLVKYPCEDCMVIMTELNNEISAQLDSHLQELPPQDQA